MYRDLNQIAICFNLNIYKSPLFILFAKNKMFNFHSFEEKINQCFMPSFDNQKNVNTQHRRGKTNISQGYCKNK